MSTDNLGKLRNIVIEYEFGQIVITKSDLEKIVSAKEALEQIAYALTIAKELNKLNERVKVN